MSALLVLVIVIIVVALIFDYINGFHDAANSVATIVATRVLTPFQAVIWAAGFNFAAALPLLFSAEAGVARTVGENLVNLDYVTPIVILAGLMGAIAWNLITWFYGIPSSSSHALIGGYAGAVMCKVAMLEGIGAVMKGVKIEGWIDTTKFIVLAPLIGLALGYLLMGIVYWMFKNSTPSKMDRWFRRLQLLSSALFSFAHGSNDAQKTVGIITGVLVSAGYLKEFHVQGWVILSAFGAIALGTMTGGWRIVHTMGSKLTRLKPRGGFCAETAGAIAILIPTYLKIPVSTTHIITGAIAGVGSINRVKSVRWGLARQLVWAWVLTLPASAFVAAVCYYFVAIIAKFAGWPGAHPN